MNDAVGSRWRRWDLHVHTPESYQNGYGSWDSYLAALEAVEPDVVAIGLTDYFSIDGYKIARGHQAAGRLRNFDLLLPNVELRLNTFIVGRNGRPPRRQNFHVIFSDDVEPDTIEEQFLSDLYIQFDGGPEGPDRWHLTRNSIEQAGRLVRAHNTAFANDTDYTAGCKSITVELNDVIRALGKTCFQRKHLLVLATENWDQIDWAGQDYLTRALLLKQAHALFSGNPTIREWALGKADVTPEAFIEEFGSLKPTIHGSDAHAEAGICLPAEQRRCWIKADPTFEGLRQIVYEPELRVRIQPRSPQEDRMKLAITGIEITTATGFPVPGGTKVKFNRDMAAIIGGRGNGKSALAECVAYCFGKHGKELLLGRKERFIPHFIHQGARAAIRVTTADLDGNLSTEEYPLQDNGEVSTFPIVYLGQNRIEDFAGDDLQIHDLVSQTVLSSSGRLLDIQASQNRISSLRADISSTTNEIRLLKREIGSTDSERLIAERKAKEDQRQLLSSDDTRAALTRLSEARARLAQIVTITQEAAKTGAVVERTAHELNAQISALEGKARELMSGLTLPRVDVSSALDGLWALENTETRTSAEAEYEHALECAKAVAQGALDAPLERVASLTDEIDDLTSKIESLRQRREQLETKRRHRLELLSDLSAEYETLRGQYEEAIGDYMASSTTRAILCDVQLRAEVEFRIDGLLEGLFAQCVDRRKCRTLDALRAVIPAQTVGDYIAWLGSHADDDDTYSVMLDSSRHDVEDRLLDVPLSLRTAVGLQRGNSVIPIEDLSLGQKGTVVLKLFLATTDCPIILDQPEDHLDNSYVYSNLVPTIVEAKKKRQVIVITHNANLVVNGDAEQIIVAEFRDGEIRYQSGALENPAIREQASTVLEGGEDAFLRRERKYGLQH